MHRWSEPSPPRLLERHPRQHRIPGFGGDGYTGGGEGGSGATGTGCGTNRDQIRAGATAAEAAGSSFVDQTASLVTARLVDLEFIRVGTRDLAFTDLSGTPGANSVTIVRGTRDGTARAGGDHRARTARSLTIPAGRGVRR